MTAPLDDALERLRLNAECGGFFEHDPYVQAADAAESEVRALVDGLRQELADAQLAARYNADCTNQALAQVATLEAEREIARRALVEIASGRRPGAVNNEAWHVAAKRFINRARRSLRGDVAPLTDEQRATITANRAASAHPCTICAGTSWYMRELPGKRHANQCPNGCAPTTEDAP